MSKPTPAIELEVPYIYEADAIMPRGRKSRHVYLQGGSPLRVSIPSITPQDAPCALVISEVKFRQDGAEVVMDTNQKRLLAFNEQLWLPAVTHHDIHTDRALTLVDLQKRLTDGAYPWRAQHSIPIDAVREIVASKEGDRIAEIFEQASRYAVIDGVLFTTCEEPCFEIDTLGLGHNHGATVLSVRMSYNPNLNRSRYFRADQRAEAIAAAERIALGRGDTQSVPVIPYGNIEVLLPEWVRRHPEIDGPEGDPFIQRVQSIAASAPDADTAALGVLVALADVVDGPDVSLGI